MSTLSRSLCSIAFGIAWVSLTGCASTAPSTQLASFNGHRSVPAGATVRFGIRSVALGLDVPIKTLSDPTPQALVSALKRLRHDHNTAAKTSFRLQPDTLALKIAGSVATADVRDLLTACQAAGFKAIAVVGIGADGRENALPVQLESTPPREATDIVFRWGVPETTKATKTVTEKGIEIATRTLVRGSGGKWTHTYRVQRGRPVDGVQACPAIPARPTSAAPDLSNVPTLAQTACSSGAPNTIHLAAPPKTRWEDVMKVANAAASASGCRSALRLEPASAKPHGCKAFVPITDNRATLEKKSEILRVLGAKSGLSSSALTKALRGTGSLGRVWVGTSGVGLGAGTGGIKFKGGLTGGGGGGSITMGAAARTTRRLKLIRTKVTGYCDAGIAARVLRRRRAQLEYCVSRSTAPPKSRSLTLKLTVGREGRVRKSELIGTKDKKVITCVTRLGSRLRFPKPTQGICVTTTDLRFQMPPKAPVKKATSKKPRKKAATKATVKKATMKKATTKKATIKKATIKRPKSP